MTSVRWKEETLQSAASAVFPLPLLPVVLLAKEERLSSSRRAQQRRKLHVNCFHATNAAVAALNYLFCSRYSCVETSKNSFFSSSPPSSLRSLVLVQASVRDFIQRVSRAESSDDMELASRRRFILSTYSSFLFSFSTSLFSVAIPPPFFNPFDSFQFLSCLDQAGLQQCSVHSIPQRDQPGKVFRWLNHRSYFGEPAGVPVLPLQASKVSLPSSISSVPLLSILPPPIAAVYSSPTNGLLSLSRAPGRPINRGRPPCVVGERQEYISLLKRLHSLSMISFTPHPKCVNGLFTVEKDSVKLRLIIDARWANQLFIEPPSVQLPNPSHIGRLFCPSNSPLYVAKCDLDNFYHQLLLPEWISEYLALPGITREELTTIVGSENCPKSREVTYSFPICKTLPMGWSHSVFIGQAVHEFVLYSDAFNSPPLSPFDNILFLDSPMVNRTLHGIVIDDIALLSSDFQGCKHQWDCVQRRYTAAGLTIKLSKSVAPSLSNSVCEVFGMSIDTEEKVVSLSPKKTTALLEHTFFVLTAPQVTGRQLSAVVGKWLWLMLLRRQSLAVLKS